MTPISGEQAVLDLEALNALVGGDPVAVTEVLDAFRRSASDVRETLRVAQEKGAMRDVADGAHKLKSAAGAVGALRLAELCSSMEGHAEASDAAAVARLMAPFNGEVSAVLKILDAR